MIIEKIQNKLLEINPPILFFFDEDKEYEIELKEYNKNDFRVLFVEDNYFTVKYQVAHREASEKLVLYHSFAQPTKGEYKDYPLTGLLLASQVLAVDELSEILDKYRVPIQFRNDIAPLQRWIKAKKYADKLSVIFTQKPFRLQTLNSAIISIILGESKTGNITHNLIRAFETMNKGEEEWEKKQKTLVSSKLADQFIEDIEQVVNVRIEDIRFESLERLFLQLKYNIITLNVAEPKQEDDYAKLRLNSDIQRIKINNFFKDWQDDKTKSKQLEPLLNHLGAEVDEGKLIRIYGTEQEYGLQTSKTFAYLMEDALRLIEINPSKVVETFSVYHNNLNEHIGFETKIQFVFYTAKFFELRARFTDFVLNNANDYIERYTNEYYLFDRYYREAFTAYQSFSEESSKAFENTFSTLNTSYDNYLIELNNPWMKEMDSIQFNYNKLAVKKQFNFYEEFVKPQTNKQVVIISDAFRYELAMELMEVLKVDSDNAMTVKPMLASIPSYTNLGMSNLLPNKEIVAEIENDTINYSINGTKTVSTYREKILQAVEPQAKVIDYATLSKMDRDAGREFFKTAQLVYVYHDWMDSIGDDKASEYYTFESAEQCIDQLVKLIKRLYGSFNIYNISLTADHGFLFNYQEISDATSQNLPKTKDNLKEHTRFVLTQDTTSSKDVYQLKLASTTNIETDAMVILPKAINRFKKKGNIGKQFVHGGASLQELIVPVFELYRNRGNQAESVGFKRNDTTRTITTSTTKFSFFQNDPLGEKYKQRFIVVGLYDKDGVLISDEVEIHLNSTAQSLTERVFDVRLEMNQEGSKASLGFLRVYDKEDKNKLNALVNDTLQIKLLEIDDF